MRVPRSFEEIMRTFVRCSLFAILCVLFDLFDISSGTFCPGTDLEEEADAFSFGKLPFQCVLNLQTCADDLCSCIGARSFSMSAGNCVGGDILAAPCDDLSFCLRLYTLCVTVSSVDAPQSCSGSWGAFLNSQIQEQFLFPDTSNATKLYKSCQKFSCHWINQTWPQCEVDYPLACHPAFQSQESSSTFAPLPSGANAPIQTMLNGAAPVTRISATVIFPGDFVNVFTSAGSIKNMKRAVEDAFQVKFGRQFICLSVEQGSLVAVVATDVARGNPTAAEAIASNIKSLNGDTSPSWIRSIASACQSSGGCASGVGSATVKLRSVSIVDTDAAGSSSLVSTSPQCGTSCIAAVVAGAAVAFFFVSLCLLKCISADEEEKVDEHAAMGQQADTAPFGRV